VEGIQGMGGARGGPWMITNYLLSRLSPEWAAKGRSHLIKTARLTLGYPFAGRLAYVATMNRATYLRQQPTGG